MPSTVTVTGKAGPGQTVTAQVFTDVLRLEYDVAPKSILRLIRQGAPIVEVEIGSQTTWTTT